MAGRPKLPLKEWLARRRASHKKSQQRYYQKNKSALRKKGRDYYDKHRDEIRIAQKERYELAVMEEATTGLTRAELVESANSKPTPVHYGVEPWAVSDTRDADAVLDNQHQPQPIIVKKKDNNDWHRETYLNDTIPTQDCEDALYGDFKPRDMQ